MSEHYRGDPKEQGALSKFLRNRWAYGSLKVIDGDMFIVSNDFGRGLAIEGKHEKAADRTWALTRHIALCCGWFAALFVYSTDDGTPNGNIDAITVTLVSPEGKWIKRDENLDFELFNVWVEQRMSPWVVG